jgi:predicted RNA-binding Zn-ribbon protein involved in translation (DUF1610 family)
MAKNNNLKNKEQKEIPISISDRIDPANAARYFVCPACGKKILYEYHAKITKKRVISCIHTEDRCSISVIGKEKEAFNIPNIYYGCTCGYLICNTDGKLIEEWADVPMWITKNCFTE